MTRRIKLSLEVTKAIAEGVQSEEIFKDNDMLRNQLVMGRFPKEVLRALSIDDLEIVTSVAIIAKMVKKHKLSAALISNLTQLICMPTAVYDSATKTGSVVVVTLYVIDQDPVIASIELNARDAYKKGEMHWMTSTYPKENHEAKFEEWREAGLLRWKRAEPEEAKEAEKDKGPQDGGPRKDA